MRGIWVEEDEAEGSIGKSGIGIEGIIPMFQCCEAEMHSFDEGVAGIVTRWKWYEISTYQGSHHGHSDFGRLLRTSVHRPSSSSG